MSGSGTRTPVAVLGATGLVGQRIVEMLHGHPWFEVAELVASERSAGQAYGSAVQWLAKGDTPAPAAKVTLKRPGDPLDSPYVFSAVSADVARELEPKYAAAGHRVVSNASAFREDPAVPLIVPEVNANTIALVAGQEWRTAGGGLVTNPNCGVVGLVLALCPIHRAFTIEHLTVVTLQALSGAGLPGLTDTNLTDNVVPHIPNEADKLQTEPRKILDGSFPVSVAVHRVPVVDGHTLAVFVKTKDRTTSGDIARALAEFRPDPGVAALPSAPSRPIVVVDENDRPQPRVDAERERGMSVTVGRVREDPVYSAGLTVVVHNLVRGAAGAAVLNAELWESCDGG